jgi:hypothetical protein
VVFDGVFACFDLLPIVELVSLSLETKFCLGMIYLERKVVHSLLFCGLWREFELFFSKSML